MCAEVEALIIQYWNMLLKPLYHAHNKYIYTTKTAQKQEPRSSVTERATEKNVREKNTTGPLLEICIKSIKNRAINQELCLSRNLHKNYKLLPS